MTQYSGSKGPEAKYQQLIKIGELKPDSQQAKVVTKLEQLHCQLMNYPAIKTRSSWFAIANWWRSHFFSKFGGKHSPRGIYLYGGVGRGKSMLMDLFYSSVSFTSKRHVHFHEFMLDVHARLKAGRDRCTTTASCAAVKRAKNNDPICVIAQQIASESTLLCFDELQITDIADAMILGRLFSELLERGVIIIATSNRHPDDLYKNGLNRQRFLPFIGRLKKALQIISLDGPTDYRYARLQGMQTYYSPVNEETTAQLAEVFFRLTDRNVDDRAKVPSAELIIQGRSLFVPKAARGVAVFSFKRLCAKPLGSADYLAIARAYHTVIVVAIPQFSQEQRSEAKRFVTLIDALYEYGVKFLCSAAVSPQLLYNEGEGSFEFTRTVSRLSEMRSQKYLAKGHGLS